MLTLEKHYKLTAQQEYEKNPKLSVTDVQELLNWSNENIRLHGKLIDLQIIMFLHACNYDKEYAKKTLYQCYTLQAKKCYPFFSTRDPAHSSIQKLMDVINYNIIHDEDTGYSYIWSQLKITDASQYYPTVAAKINFMIIDLDQIEYGTRLGYRMVLDSNNFSISHALRWSIFNAKNLMTYVQDGTYFTIDKIYMVNVTLGTEKLYSAVKPFMSSSLINKITMKPISKTNEFIKTLPQKVVPKDYGGLAPTMGETNEILKNKLLKNREYFLDEEKLRTGTVKDEVVQEDFEVEKDNLQSFKNLSID